MDSTRELKREARNARLQSRIAYVLAVLSLATFILLFGLLLGGGDQRLLLGAGIALLFTLGFGIVPLSMRHRIRRMNHLAGLSEVSDRPHPPTRRTDTVGCDSNVLDDDNANPTNTYLEGSSFGDAGSSLHREE